jgi:lysozyme family protein
VTDGADPWTAVTAIECYLRDCYFNRGPGGAARIYQMALKVKVDGDVGTNTMTAARTAELNPRLLPEDLRAARERYEREVVKRDEKSKFWKGLVNRWNNALTFSLTFIK